MRIVMVTVTVEVEVEVEVTRRCVEIALMTYEEMPEASR